MFLNTNFFCSAKILDELYDTDPPAPGEIANIAVINMAADADKSAQVKHAAINRKQTRLGQPLTGMEGSQSISKRKAPSDLGKD